MLPEGAFLFYDKLSVLGPENKKKGSYSMRSIILRDSLFGINGVNYTLSTDKKSQYSCNLCPESSLK
jgi:hypothetical protein